MREYVVAAIERVDYAGALLEDLPDELIKRVDDDLQRSLHSLYIVGQYEAMPSLLRG